eukprot:1635871-Pleurochrysis_carterae.AAC.1
MRTCTKARTAAHTPCASAQPLFACICTGVCMGVRACVHVCMCVLVRACTSAFADNKNGCCEPGMNQHAIGAVISVWG